MPAYVSLLRGINVGGNKRIAMKDLSALYVSLGLTHVQTLLQSGNVIFATTQADAAQLAQGIEAAISAHFGFQSRILLRTRQQWADTVAGHPFTSAQLAEPNKILLMFLAETVTAEAVAELQRAHQGPEQIVAGDDVLYLFYPDGMGRSRLDHPFIERRLKTTGTGRNWNTVQKLQALLATIEDA